MFSIMSCNLRGVIFDDGADRWVLRRYPCLDVLRANAVDIYCFQEMQQPQRDLFEVEFPGYRCFSTLDEIEGGGHPMNSIMYRVAAFRELGAGSFFLSETPHIPGGCSWHSHCPRYVVYLSLEERCSTRRFTLLNTHLDLDVGARLKQAELINSFAAAYPEDAPMLLAGDMNSELETLPIQSFLGHGWCDTYLEATGRKEPGLTFHAFQGYAFKRAPGEGLSGKERMDWIFRRGKIHALSSRVVDDTGRSGRFPSDHFFLSAAMEL